MFKWLVERNIFNEPSHRELLRALREQDCEVEEIQYVPFGGTRLFPRQDSRPIMTVGSINLINDIKSRNRNLSYYPGYWFNESEFSCAVYYPHFRDFLLNGSDYERIAWKHLPQHIDYLYYKLSIDDCIFLRPDAVTKGFPGQVVERDYFETFYKSYTEQMNSYDFVMASRPKHVSAEWRFFIEGPKVITGSQYKKNGHLHMERVPDGLSEPFDFASAIAQRVFNQGYRPDPVYALDVCTSDFGHCYVVEVGGFSCAGTYACDMDKLVGAVNSYSGSKHETTSTL